MKHVLPVVLAALLCSCSSWAQAPKRQQAVGGCPNVGSRNPQAVALLGQALSAAGGPGVLQQVQDFIATGTITYYWGGKQVSGRAVLRGRGIDQFRLDASLSQGTRSWWVSHGSGKRRDTDGTISTIPYHNAISMGALSFPAMRLLAAILDPRTTISDGSTVQVGGQTFYEVCVEPKLADPRLSELASAKYFLDPHTFELVGLQDDTHPKQTLLRKIPHAVYYGDFRAVSGVSIPFSVVETMYMGRTWSLQLDHISFNTGLGDSDFHF